MLFSTMTRVYTVAPIHEGPSWWESVAFFLSDPSKLWLLTMTLLCLSVIVDLDGEWLLSLIPRKPVKGYKGFNGDMTCLGFPFTPGGEYMLKEDEELCICRTGFHFCRRLSDAMNYHEPPGKVYCEVEALGKVEEFNDKCCTDHIRVVRSLSVKEIREILEREQPGNYWLMYFAQLPTKWTDGKPQTETLRQHRKRTMKHRKGYRR